MFKVFGSGQVLVSPPNRLLMPGNKSSALLCYTLEGGARWIYKRGQFKLKEMCVRKAYITQNNSKGIVILKFKSLQCLLRFNIRSGISLGISLACPHELRIRAFREVHNTASCLLCQ